MILVLLHCWYFHVPAAKWAIAVRVLPLAEPRKPDRLEDSDQSNWESQEAIGCSTGFGLIRRRSLSSSIYPQGRITQCWKCHQFKDALVPKKIYSYDYNIDNHSHIFSPKYPSKCIKSFLKMFSKIGSLCQVAVIRLSSNYGVSFQPFCLK